MSREEDKSFTDASRSLDCLVSIPGLMIGREELRKRFAKAETTLFRLRFESDDAEEKQAFLQSLHLDWTIVRSISSSISLSLLRMFIGSSRSDTLSSSDLIFLQVGDPEKRAFESQLRALHPKTFDAETFYKVPWTLVPDLVEKRKVFLSKGFAYVPKGDQISLILQAFSERLERGLEVSFLPSSSSLLHPALVQITPVAGTDDRSIWPSSALLRPFLLNS
jgi:DNA primase large subunit